MPCLVRASRFLCLAGLLSGLAYAPPLTAQTVRDSVRMTLSVFQYAYPTGGGAGHNCGAGIVATWPDIGPQLFGAPGTYSMYSRVATEGMIIPFGWGQTGTDPVRGITVPDNHFGHIPHWSWRSAPGNPNMDGCEGFANGARSRLAGGWGVLNAAPYRITDWYAVLSVPNGQPIALYEWEQTTGLTVDFDGSFESRLSHEVDNTATGGRRPVFDYVWAFGDGQSSRGALSSHTYATDGEYTVSLTVTDDDGQQSTYSEVVTVEAAYLRVEVTALSGEVMEGDTLEVVGTITSAGTEPVFDVEARQAFSYQMRINEELNVQGSVQRSPALTALPLPVGEELIVMRGELQPGASFEVRRQFRVDATAAYRPQGGTVFEPLDSEVEWDQYLTSGADGNGDAVRVQRPCLGRDPIAGCDDVTVVELARIAVTAPGFDEIVPPGEPYTVRFTAPPGVQAVDLYLVERVLNPDNGERVLIAEDILVTAGTYLWDVPESLLSPSTFLIAVDASDPALEAVSERFRARDPWRIHRIVGTFQEPEYDQMAVSEDAWSFNQDAENMWPEAYYDKLWHYYGNTEIGYDRFIPPVFEVRYDPEYFYGHTDSDYPPWTAAVRAFEMPGMYASAVSWTFGGLQLHQPNPIAAENWNQDTAGKPFKGACYGLSMAMMAAFQDPDRFDAKWLPMGGGSEHLATVPLSDEARDAAHALFVYQNGRLQRNQNVLYQGVTPRETLERLRLMFERDDRDRDRFLVFVTGYRDAPEDPWEEAAHAVVPIGMKRIGEGLYEIGVYDPNFGGTGAAGIYVDSTANSWYHSDDAWRGETGTGFYLSIEARHAFATALPWWPRVFEENAPAPPLAEQGGGSHRFVSIVGAAGAVISDAGVLRYEQGVLTETLPGGFVQFPYTGQPADPDAYVVPAGSGYRAEALPRADGTARVRVEGGPVTASFAQAPGETPTRAVLDLLDDGLEVVSGGSGVFTLSAQTVVTDSTEIRTLRAAELAAANPAGLRLTADAETFRLSGAQASGTYELRVRAAAAGANRAFFHADVPLGAGAVHTVHPSWSDLATVTVEVDADGDGDTDETLVLVNEGMPVSIEPDGPDGLPTAYALHAAYPNPFNPVTTLKLDMPEAGEALVEAYDTSGRRVAVLIDGVLEAGRNAVRFDASGLPSGVYIVRAIAGGDRLRRVVTLMR